MLNSLIKITKKRKVVGRGGDRGGTSGKGHKGQKARSGGGVKAQFEGGQTPLTRRLPKRGFNNAVFAVRYTVLSTDIFLRSELAADQEITKLRLVEAGLLKKVTERLKLLAGKQPVRALTVHVDACSKSARSLVEQAGGAVVVSNPT